ncbi:hypothetical protein LXL04_030279 [Taraxacum kok-saghyz]
MMSKTLFYIVSAGDCRLEQEDDGPSGEIPTTLRVLGIMVAALVLIWNIRYRGGLAPLISDKQNLIFNILASEWDRQYSQYNRPNEFHDFAEYFVLELAVEDGHLWKHMWNMGCTFLNKRWMVVVANEGNKQSVVFRRLNP